MKKENEVFELCPEYIGIARIVDLTQPAVEETPFGTRTRFRFILEIDALKSDGVSKHTVTTKPFTISLHPKSGLREFIQKVLGRPLTTDELMNGFEIKSLIGKFLDVIVEHRTSDDGTKIYANIVHYSKPKNNPVLWNASVADKFSKDLSEMEYCLLERTCINCGEPCSWTFRCRKCPNGKISGVGLLYREDGKLFKPNPKGPDYNNTPVKCICGYNDWVAARHEEQDSNYCEKCNCNE